MLLTYLLHGGNYGNKIAYHQDINSNQLQKRQMLVTCSFL